MIVYKSIKWEKAVIKDGWLKLFKLVLGKPKNFKTIIGHTNFDLGRLEVKSIIDTQGVDSFEVFSPYIFKITIGENFPKFTKVLRDIEKGLGCINRKYQINQEILDEITYLKNKLETSGKMWIIFIFTNGQYEFFASDNKEEYQNVSKNYLRAQKEIGGYISSSI